MIQENTFPHPLPNSASSQESTCSSVGSSRSCSPFKEIPTLEWAYPPPATPPDWSIQHTSPNHDFNFSLSGVFWPFLNVFSEAPPVSLMSSALSSGGGALELAGTSCVQYGQPWLLTKANPEVFLPHLPHQSLAT